MIHLLENLSRHEQPKGVMLAIGVVAPMLDALENQLKAFGGKTRADMPELPLQLSVLAFVALAQQWLNELRKFYPALDPTTIVIRNRGAEEGIASAWNHKSSWKCKMQVETEA